MIKALRSLIFVLSVLSFLGVEAQDKDTPESKESVPVVSPSKEKSSTAGKSREKSKKPEDEKAIDYKAAPKSKPYTIKKSIIKDQVDALKTEVMSQKTQTVILKDLIKKEGLDGSKRPLIISLKNTLSEKYIVDSVMYKLNGDIVYQYVSDEHADLSPELRGPKPQIEASLVPGPYSLEVFMVYRGNDSGVFSYLKDYRITREVKTSVEIKKVNETRVEVQTFESGSLLSDFKDRPQIKINQL